MPNPNLLISPEFLKKLTRTCGWWIVFHRKYLFSRWNVTNLLLLCHYLQSDIRVNHTPYFHQTRPSQLGPVRLRALILTRLHSLHIPTVRRKFHPDNIISRKLALWNWPMTGYFPEHYNLNLLTMRFQRLCIIYILIIYTICFLPVLANNNLI